jgi:molybdopterin-synthase adenylyltransferase
MVIFLSDLELLRYQRQVMLPYVGEEGQKKIKNAKVFIAGIGGLGSISASYLVAAGIGHITFVDGDKVELGNLNRQIIHWTSDINKWKADSALVKLKDINPHCHITSIQERIKNDNIMDLLGDCSIIVDATDNIQVRHVLNMASLGKRIPFIYGGVREFGGMITTFVPGETPCFECVFPSMIPQEKIFGIFGPVAGVAASLQTIEVLKIILGIGELMKGKLLHFNLLNMKFRKISIEKNSDCMACGKISESDYAR